MNPTISRRTILRGLGASVLLPAMPSLSRAETAAPVHRYLFWYIPVGMFAGAFHPATTGTGWTAPAVLVPLERHRSRLTVVSGLSNLDAAVMAPFDPHVVYGGAVLTGEYIVQGAAQGPQGGRSVDQVIADRIAGSTPFRSLELSSDEGYPCLPGLDCVYLQNISWQDAATPRSRELSPRRAFERMFGSTQGVGDAAAQQARIATQRSVLDFVREASTRVVPRLGAEDRIRFGDYLDGLRDVERRLDLPTTACTADASTVTQALQAADYDNAAHIDLMHALMGLAFACDQTRVATFMPSNERSVRVYRDIGHVDTHHWLSHHNGISWKRAATQQVQVWLMDRLAGLLDELASRPDPAGGTLLDHTTVVAIGGMGEPNAHLHTDIPVLLAGGSHQTGQHLRFAGRPHGDLLLTLARQAGCDDTVFGREGTQAITELL